MGRRSNAVQSRLQNLGQPPQSHRAHVDDVTDSEDEDYLPSPPEKGASDDYGFIVFEDYESDGDDYTPGSSDSETEDESSDLEDEDRREIRNDADLLRFSAILVEAQQVAVKLEQEMDKPKRAKHYTGNAPHTKRFHAKKRRTLAAEGQKFISQFFPARAMVPKATHQPYGGSDPDSSDEESIIDIDEHLDRIFGEEVDLDEHMASPSEKEMDDDFYSVSARSIQY